MLRASQIGWTEDYLLDIMADFLRFYSIRIDPFNDDFNELTGPQFFSLAYRLSAYDGLISRAFERSLEKAKQEEEFNNPTIQTDATGKRIKGTAAVDFIKRNKSNKPADLLGQLAAEGLVEIQK